MAINILEMIQGAMGNSVAGQIGGLLGESESNTGTAVGAALPAILGGLMKQSSTPAGAQEIFNNTSNFDGGMLGNLAGALGGGNHSSLIQTGTSLLGSIFGSGQSGLISSIARMAGIGQGSAGSLLGLLVPIVMSAISKVRASDNLDAGGLASMLASQKDHVASALPSDLRSDLGLNDMLGKGMDAVRGAGAAATSAAGSAVDAAGNFASNTADAAGNVAGKTADAAADTARAGGSLIGKLLPLIILAAIAWFAWKFFAGGEATDAVPDKPAISDAASGAMANVEELQGKLTSSVGDMTSALGEIKDADTATAAVEKLKGAASGLEGLGLDKLPDAAKGPLAGAVGPLLEKLKSAVETAYAIPGVKAVIEPVVGPVLEQLTGLAG